MEGEVKILNGGACRGWDIYSKFNIESEAGISLALDVFHLNVTSSLYLLGLCLWDLVYRV